MQNTSAELTLSELQQALREALARQFEVRGPSGQVVTEAPSLVDVFPESQELIWRDQGGFLRGPYLVNADHTVSIGVGVRVQQEWTPLTATQRAALGQAVEEQFRLQRQPGDAPPSIVEIQAALAPASSPYGSVIVKFKNEFSHVPYLFDDSSGRCWVGSGHPVLRYGRHFGPPPVAIRGLEMDVLAKSIQDVLHAQGIDVQYSKALIAAGRVLACPSGTPKAEFAALMTELLRGTARTPQSQR